MYDFRKKALELFSDLEHWFQVNCDENRITSVMEDSLMEAFYAGKGSPIEEHLRKEYKEHLKQLSQEQLISKLMEFTNAGKRDEEFLQTLGGPFGGSYVMGKDESNNVG